MVHGRPGPAPQTAKREQFARLIERGMSSSEACRVVGIYTFSLPLAALRR